MTFTTVLGTIELLNAKLVPPEAQTESFCLHSSDTFCIACNHRMYLQHTTENVVLLGEGLQLQIELSTWKMILVPKCVMQEGWKSVCLKNI